MPGPPDLDLRARSVTERCKEYWDLLSALSKLTSTSDTRKSVILSTANPMSSTSFESMVADMLDHRQLSSLADIYAHLSVPIPPVERFLTSLVTTCIAALKRVPEEEVQANLFDHWISQDSEACAVDTHRSNFGLPHFKHIAADEDTVWYAATARPDVTSMVMPMFLELQPHNSDVAIMTDNEYLVLKQAVERVFCTASLNECLTRVVCFATTGWFSWIVVMTRDCVKHALSDTYTVFSISADMIHPLWDTITQTAIQSPTYFCSSDGYLVSQTLRQLGINSAYCAVKKAFQSGSAVYSIGLCHHDPVRKTVVVDLLKQHLMIKVNTNPQRASKEVAALRVLKNTLASAYSMSLGYLVERSLSTSITQIL